MRRGENIYRRKDGRWEGRYKKGRKMDGKIKYGYVYGQTLQEVRMKLYPLKVKYQTIRNMHGNSCIPFEEWGNQWLSKVQRDVKPATYANYHYKLVKYVFPYIGDQLLNELTPESGKQLIHEWVVYGLSVSTMKTTFRILCQSLNEAKNMDYLKENPFSTTKLPKEKKHKVRSLSKQEQQCLETIVDQEESTKSLPTYMALYTGMRIGELAALRWSEIDFDRNLIQVSHTYQRIPLAKGNQKTQLVYDTAKTDAAVRVIPFDKKLKRKLLQLKTKATGEYVFSQNNRPVEPRLLTYHFHRLRKRARIQDIHFHQLRHTFATRCLEAQGDISSVSALLGHTSTQLTLDTYADSMIEQRIQVIVQMEKILE